MVPIGQTGGSGVVKHRVRNGSTRHNLLTAHNFRVFGVRHDQLKIYRDQYCSTLVPVEE